MAEFETLKRAIQDSSELWVAGEHEKALKLLDDSIVVAAAEGRKSWVRTLSHHAAVLASSVANLGLVKHYYEQSLAHNPGNPRALYGLANVLLEQGEIELARNHAAKCHEAILQSEDEIDRGLLDLIAKRWPEIVAR